MSRDPNDMRHAADAARDQGEDDAFAALLDAVGRAEPADVAPDSGADDEDDLAAAMAAAVAAVDRRSPARPPIPPASAAGPSGSAPAGSALAGLPLRPPPPRGDAGHAPAAVAIAAEEALTPSAVGDSMFEDAPAPSPVPAPAPSAAAPAPTSAASAPSEGTAAQEDPAAGDGSPVEAATTWSPGHDAVVQRLAHALRTCASAAVDGVAAVQAAQAVAAALDAVPLPLELTLAPPQLALAGKLEIVTAETAQAARVVAAGLRRGKANMLTIAAPTPAPAVLQALRWLLAGASGPCPASGWSVGVWNPADDPEARAMARLDALLTCLQEAQAAPGPWPFAAVDARLDALALSLAERPGAVWRAMAFGHPRGSAVRAAGEAALLALHAAAGTSVARVLGHAAAGLALAMPVGSLPPLAVADAAQHWRQRGWHAAPSGRDVGLVRVAGLVTWLQSAQAPTAPLGADALLWALYALVRQRHTDGAAPRPLAQALADAEDVDAAVRPAWDALAASLGTLPIGTLARLPDGALAVTVDNQGPDALVDDGSGLRRAPDLTPVRIGA